MKRQPLTKVIEKGGYEFRFTQHLIPEFQMGHYYWSLSKDGDLVSIGQSCGCPPDLFAKLDIWEVRNRAVRDYKERLELDGRQV